MIPILLALCNSIQIVRSTLETAFRAWALNDIIHEYGKPVELQLWLRAFVAMGNSVMIRVP